MHITIVAKPEKCEDFVMRTYGYMAGLCQVSQPGVTIVLTNLISVLQPLLMNIDLDEDWYCKHNLDVRQAIANHDWASARAHYVGAGFFENRMPYHIDVEPNWYLAEYHDVADAVEDGKFRSPQQHFDESGFQEGRLPCQDWTFELRERPGQNYKPRISKPSLALRQVNP